MNFTRRGFLGTTLAAIGAAVFDPMAKIWQPKTVLAMPATVQPATGILSAEALAFNDLAQRVATAFGQRLSARSWPGIVLSDVQYKRSEYSGILEIDGNHGRFAPFEHRIMTSAAPGFRLSERDLPHALASGLDLPGYLIAPITGELRPGEPFDRDMAVALATDPVTGVMIRLLGWENDSGGRNGQQMYGLEVAQGKFINKRHPVGRL